MAHGQHGSDGAVITSANAQQTNSRKIQKQVAQNAALSPSKKGPGIGNERAPGVGGASSKDMSLQNADGPVRAGGNNAANAEASLFNKHYNKELKLCEGKFNINLIKLK